MRENFKPTVLRVFGGLVTFIDRVALSLGVSPRAENVKLAPGMVGSRDGFELLATDGESPYVGITQHVSQTGARTLLVVDGAGRLLAKTSSWNSTVLDETLNVAAPAMRSAAMFGKQYMCFGNGESGTMPMYRYDGTKASLVGAEPPGKAPVLAVSVAAAGAAGGLAEGTHSGVVVFVNEHGDVSGWSPVASYPVGAGDVGKQVSVTPPLGPPGTAQRIIAITPANDARSFLYTKKMILTENTTSSAVSLDISEDELVSSQLSVTRWLTSFVPWDPLGVEAVQERLVTWGARLPLQPGVRFNPAVSPTVLQNVGLRNLSFGGGFNAGSSSGVPNGWTATAGATGIGIGGGPGGASRAGSTDTPFYGKCYRITGGDYPDGMGGSTPYQGSIYQQATNDSDYLRAKGKYRLSIKYRTSAGLTGGAGSPLRVVLAANAPIGTLFDTTSLLLSNSDVWLEANHDFDLNLATEPTTLTITIEGRTGANRIPDGEWVDLRVALVDREDLQHLHTLFVSDSGRPGTFVGEAGIVSVGPDDGQGIRSVFRIRDNVFVAKERSLHSLQSQSYGDPVTWGVSLYDEHVGTQSIAGVATGSGVAVIAGRSGVYLFDGASLRLISREIQGALLAADWASYGSRAVVVLDHPGEKLYVFVRTLSVSGVLWQADFREGWGSPMPEGSGLKWTKVTLANGNDAVSPYAIVACGALALGASGELRPMLSVTGISAFSSLASPDDLSAPTWTFTPAVTATAGQGDGRGGTRATRWQAASAATAGRNVGTGGGTVTFRATAWPANGGVSFGVGDPVVPTPLGDLGAGGAFRRYVAVVPVQTGSTGVLTFHLPAGADTLVADLRLIANRTDQCDPGCVGGIGNQNASAIVSPFADLRSDFCGRIRAAYETAPFGEELGRSTFDTCIVRARGSGYLTAQYNGTGSRSWAMTSVQLTENPDEDVEFGADLKAPAASLVLGTSGYGAWFVVNRVAVANKAESVGWQRGRNN